MEITGGDQEKLVTSVIKINCVSLNSSDKKAHRIFAINCD